MTRLALLLLLVSPLFSSCFFGRRTTNAPIASQSVAQLEPGRSTEADVTRILGAPTDVVQLARRSAWRYDFTRSKTAGLFLFVFTLTGSETQQDRVWVFFDENGLLTHYGATLDADRVKYAAPPLSPGVSD